MDQLEHLERVDSVERPVKQALLDPLDYKESEVPPEAEDKTAKLDVPENKGLVVVLEPLASEGPLDPLAGMESQEPLESGDPQDPPDLPVRRYLIINESSDSG